MERQQGNERSQVRPPSLPTIKDAGKLSSFQCLSPLHSTVSWQGCRSYVMAPVGLGREIGAGGGRRGVL